jgi:hypothetical protein
MESVNTNGVKQKVSSSDLGMFCGLESVKFVGKKKNVGALFLVARLN